MTDPNPPSAFIAAIIAIALIMSFVGLPLILAATGETIESVAQAMTAPDTSAAPFELTPVAVVCGIAMVALVAIGAVAFARESRKGQQRGGRGSSRPLPALTDTATDSQLVRHLPH